MKPQGTRQRLPQSKVVRKRRQSAQKGAAIDADAVLATIRDKLARFKQPKAAVVVADLPRNTMGKVQKNLLRDQYKALFA